jgi:hypothetical protein
MSTKCGVYTQHQVVDAYLNWLQGKAAADGMAVTEDMTLSGELASEFSAYFKELTGVELDEKTLMQVMIAASERFNVERRYWGTRRETLAVERIESSDYISYRQAARILEKKLNAAYHKGDWPYLKAIYQSLLGGNRVSRALNFIQVSHANRPTRVLEEMGATFLSRKEIVEMLRELEPQLEQMAGKKLSMVGYQKLLFRVAYLNPTWLKTNYSVLYDLVMHAVGPLHEAINEYAINARKLLSLPTHERVRELSIDSDFSIRDTAESLERPRGYVKNLVAKFLTEMSDRQFEAIQAYRYMLSVTGKKMPPARYDFEIQLRLMNGRDRRLAQVIALGIPNPETGTFMTGGGLAWLMEPLANAGENTEEVARDAIMYMVALRTQELHRLHAERQTRQALLERTADEPPESLPEAADTLSGIGSEIETELEAAKAIIDHIKEKYGESVKHLEEAHARYVEWSRALLHYAQKRNYISKADFDTMTRGSEYYVALLRVIADPVSEGEGEDVLKAVIESRQSSSSGLMGATEVLRRLQGSAKEIQNPYVSLIQMTQRIMDEVDRNAVKAAFLMPILPDGVLPINAANASEEELYDELNFNATLFGSIARPVSSSAKITKNVIEVRLPTKDGSVVKTLWHIPDADLAAALGPGTKLDNKAARAVAAVITMVRNMYTKNPQFVIRNLFRDVQSANLMFGTLAPAHASVMSMFREAREMYRANKVQGNRNSLWRTMELWGGGQFGYFMTDPGSYKKMLIDAIKQSGGNINVVVPHNMLRSFLDKLEGVMASTESASRLAAFNRHKEDYIRKHGNDPDFEIADAYYYAAYKARSLTDFAVAGSTIKLLNYFVPFLNAGVQGLKAEWRTITTGRGFARIMAYNLIGAAIEGLWNEWQDATEELATLPMWRKLTFWNFKIGNLWIMVPKPFGLFAAPSYFFQTGLIKYHASRMPEGSGERMSIETALNIEMAKGVNPYSLYRHLYYAISPLDVDLLAPPGISPLVFNYDAFRDRPIVPDYEQEQAVDERKGTKYSSKISQMLSSAVSSMGIGLDPRNIDVAISEFFGWYGKVAVSMTREYVDPLPVMGLGWLGRSAGGISPQAQMAMQMARRFSSAGFEADSDTDDEGMTPAGVSKAYMEVSKMFQDMYTKASSSAEKERIARDYRIFAASLANLFFAIEEPASTVQKVKKEVDYSIYKSN